MARDELTRRKIMNNFTKPVVALGLAGALALAMATPSEARSGRTAAAIGAGVAGFAVGAAIGSAAANHYGYYGGPYGYYDGYAYAPGPAYVDSYAYTPRTYYYGGDPSSYYAPTYSYPRYRYRNSNREDHLTGTGAGFID
jgi:hypothetical protein